MLFMHLAGLLTKALDDFDLSIQQGLDGVVKASSQGGSRNPKKLTKAQGLSVFPGMKGYGPPQLCRLWSPPSVLQLDAPSLFVAQQAVQRRATAPAEEEVQ